MGHCDCGSTYDSASRFDHDGDTGQCWTCSDRDIATMTDEELAAYLAGISSN